MNAQAALLLMTLWSVVPAAPLEKVVRPAVLRIDHHVAPNTAEVIIMLNYAAVKAKPQILSASIAAAAAMTHPHRIYVDLPHYGVLPKVALLKHQGFLAQIRIAVRQHHILRIVLDMQQSLVLQSKLLAHPWRLLLRVRAQHPTTLLAATAPQSVKPQLTPVNKLRVVIDPGHGGHDSGAIGPHDLLEKDVVLSIARFIAPELHVLGIDTFYTRTTDTFLSLEERTLYANRMHAHAFVSIHANAADNHQARGIETYYLNVTDDRYSLRLAAIENKTPQERVDALRLILADLSMKASSRESKILADGVQKSLYQAAKSYSPTVRDLGVKASLFYVLLGARMPAILVETSFISNKEEAALLKNRRYQHTLAKALAKAIANHLKPRPLRPTLAAG